MTGGVCSRSPHNAQYCTSEYLISSFNLVMQPRDLWSQLRPPCMPNTLAHWNLSKRATTYTLIFSTIQYSPCLYGQLTNRHLPSAQYTPLLSCFYFSKAYIYQPLMAGNQGKMVYYRWFNNICLLNTLVTNMGSFNNSDYYAAPLIDMHMYTILCVWST